MKKYYLLMLAISIYFIPNAQTFHKSFSLIDHGGILYRCIRTADGGYAAVGHVTSNGSFNDDFLVMKVDAQGNSLWTKVISTSESGDCSDIIETDDHGLVIVGSSFSMTSFISSAIVEKLNSGGEKQWSKSYTISGLSSSASKIQKDNQGNLYVLGTVDVSGASSDYFIMELDANGGILHQSTFGTPDMDYPLSFVRKANGDMFIGGWDNTFTGENIHLLKVNASLVVEWNKLVSGSIKYFAYDMREKSNGNMILAGRYDDGTTTYDVLIMEVDAANGNIVWAKSYSPVDDLPCYAYGLTINSGDLIGITGLVEDASAGTLLLETSQSGAVNISERISSTQEIAASGYGITTTPDNGYVVCGPRGDAGSSIVQLLTTLATGAVSCSSSAYSFLVTDRVLPLQNLTIITNSGNLVAQDITLSESVYHALSEACLPTDTKEIVGADIFTVSPNPSDGKFRITLAERLQNASLKVYNLAGIKVYEDNHLEESINFSGMVMIDLKLPEGIYFIQLLNNSKLITHKLIIR